jgi:hypothetical protein
MNFDTVLERTLARYAKQDEVIALRTAIDRIQARVKSLEDGTLTFDKEVYTAKDLEPIMGLKAATITKKYLRTGTIEAWIPSGTKSYQIKKREFQRVVEIIKSQGTWALGA